MNWEQYRQNFIIEARANGKSTEYIDQWVTYAKTLFNKELPVIYSFKHLASLVGYKARYLGAMAWSQQHFYRSFKIKKANGKMRKIDEPLPDLKFVQRWILNEVLMHCDVSPYAKAYMRGKSVRENARFHRKQALVLTIDIKDFFTSIVFGRVLQLFRSMGYTKQVASVLASLCCYKGCLPQGAPTSPAISNLIFSDLDKAIGNYCLNRGYRYTRYADDLTFSGELDVSKLLSFINRELNATGFILNKSKTRVAGRGARQEVTGIVVNEKLQLPMHERRKIRQAVYYIEQYGLDSHLSYIAENRSSYLNHLLGKITYGLHINPKDEELQRYKSTISSLLGGKLE